VSTPTICGLDIGTLGVKGVIVTVHATDELGAPSERIKAQARVDHAINEPKRGWSEQDADSQWWGDTVTVIRELLAQASVDPQSIVAIGVSGLTPCLCLLDADGLPIRPAILYGDNRALAQLARARTVLDPALTAQAITPKWLWLSEFEPSALARASAICSSHNYVVFRLTGRLAVDYDTASIFGGIFDADRRSWERSACEALGLDASLLPVPCAVTDVVGHVSTAAARVTGLPAGIPVIAGTGDTFPTIVGCGAIAPGDAMVSFGSTGLLTLTTRPLASAVHGPHFMDAAEGGAVKWATNVLACGRLLTWFREGFGAAITGCEAGPDGLPTLASLDSRAAEITAGSNNLVALPHLLGRRTPQPDPSARGVLFGLAPGHSALHVYRALLESFGYAVRRGYEPIIPEVRRIVATAGGAASAPWRQILADILAREIEYFPGASGALGVAFIAAYATGCVERFEDIRDHWLSGPVLTRPIPANAERYDALYRVYCCLDDGLDQAFELLASLTSDGDFPGQGQIVN
jgi:xylulokinase